MRKNSSRRFSWKGQRRGKRKRGIGLQRDEFEMVQDYEGGGWFFPHFTKRLAIRVACRPTARLLYRIPTGWDPLDEAIARTKTCWKAGALF